MDRSLYKAIEDFVSRRINHYGMNEKDAVNEAYQTFHDAALRLRETLDAEQAALFKTCEDTYRLADGETCYYYYKAGFGDALRFLMGWGGDLSEIMGQETK